MNTPKLAKGMKGCLLSFNGNITFRVYDERDREKFVDYQVAHHDLDITIEDEDAYVYENKEGEPVIDYSPATLGR